MGHQWAWAGLVVVLLLAGTNSQRCGTVPPECYYDGAATIDPTLTQPNQYFVIGGLFDIHERGDNAYTCSSTMSTEGIINSLAFFWAITQYKALIASSVSVGAAAFDTCSRPEQTIETVLGYAQCDIHIQDMQQDNLVAYVGPYGNEETLGTEMLASDLGVTMLSPTANALGLNSLDGSSLLQMRPSLDNDLMAIQAFLKTLDSSFAIVLYDGSDPLWTAAFERMKSLLATNVPNLCVQFEANVKDFSTAAMTSFVDNELQPRIKAKYVVPLMSREKLSVLLDAIYQNSKVNGELRFILTSDIGKDKAFLTSKNNAAKNAIVIESDYTSIYGNYSVVFNLFRNFINSGAQPLTGVTNPWLDEFRTSGQSIPVLNADTRSPLVSSAMRTIVAVDIIMNGLKTALEDCDRLPGANNYQFCDKYRNQRNKNNQLYNVIKNGKPNNQIWVANSGELREDKAVYTYNVWVNDGTISEFRQIGEYRRDRGPSILANWLDDLRLGQAFSASTCPTPGECCEPPSTVAPPTTKPPTVMTVAPATTEAPKFSMVRYRLGQVITGAFPAEDQDADRTEWGTRFDQGHKWIIALGVLAGVGLLAVIVFEIYILYKLLGTRMGHKWRTMWLGQLLLLGIFLAYLVLFAYIFIPTKATCGITRFGVGFSYAVCFAVLLVKLMVILTSKSSDNILLPGDESPNYLKGVYQFLMFVFAVGVQIVIDVQWLITVPPEAVRVTGNNGDSYWVCNHYTWDAELGMDNMGDFVRTNFENHLMSLTYIMVMILMTTLLSLNSHGIITNHRESVFIGIAAGFSIPVWLAWGLVGGLNKDHDFGHEFGDACIAFGLFLTVTLILFSMFLPKVRQLVNMGVEGIYLEDDRDTYYAGSVIMAPSSYKSKGPGSVVYVNNQGIYSEPVVIGNGDPNSTHLKHPMSTYSAPINPTYLKKTESAYGSTRLYKARDSNGEIVLRVTDDLRGRHPQKGSKSEVAYGSQGRPRSVRGTLERSRSQTSLGAL